LVILCWVGLIVDPSHAVSALVGRSINLLYTTPEPETKPSPPASKQSVPATSDPDLKTAGSPQDTTIRRIEIELAEALDPGTRLGTAIQPGSPTMSPLEDPPALSLTNEWNGVRPQGATTSNGGSARRLTSAGPSLNGASGGGTQLTNSSHQSPMDSSPAGQTGVTDSGLLNLDDFERLNAMSAESHLTDFSTESSTPGTEVGFVTEDFNDITGASGTTANGFGSSFEPRDAFGENRTLISDAQQLEALVAVLLPGLPDSVQSTESPTAFGGVSELDPAAVTTLSGIGVSQSVLEDLSAQSVPEPSSMALLTLGAFTILARQRYRINRKPSP